MKLRTILIAGAALLIAGCSTSQTTTFDNSPLGQGLRNIAAGDCSTPAAQAAFAANLPSGLLPESQVTGLVAQLCMGLFGTVAAPASAPGNAPAIPAPAAK